MCHIKNVLPSLHYLFIYLLIYQDLHKLITPSQQVTDSTLGIVGMGNIGKALAEKAKGFRMNILYHTRTRKELQVEKHLGKPQTRRLICNIIYLVML